MLKIYSLIFVVCNFAAKLLLFYQICKYYAEKFAYSEKKVVPLHAFFARRYQRVTAKRLKILTF